MACPEGCISSDLVTWLRIIPMWLAVAIAFFGYQIGKKYFNKGQKNIVQLESLKRFYDHFNRIKAELAELERIQGKLLANNYDIEEVDGYLEVISSLHTVLNKLTKEAMFIEELKEFRGLYLNYYDTWYLDGKGVEVFYEEDQGEKSKALKAIKSTVEESFSKLKTKLEKILKSKESTISKLGV